MVIWDSASFGGSGPGNRSVVGRLCPNRSTSPGPDRLKLGAVAPTVTTWPATLTVCAGVIRTATAIAIAATTRKAANSATCLSSRWRQFPEGPGGAGSGGWATVMDEVSGQPRTAPGPGGHLGRQYARCRHSPS